MVIIDILRAVPGTIQAYSGCLSTASGVKSINYKLSYVINYLAPLKGT
jgi:hypothetical protein